MEQGPGGTAALEADVKNLAIESEDPRLKLGNSKWPNVKYGEDKGEPSFSSCPGPSFNVRGENYSKQKKKFPSLDCFYELVTGEVFKSPNKIPKIGPHLTWPPVFEWPCNSEETKQPEPSPVVHAAGCPRTLVFNMMLPSYEPSMLGSKSDGQGYSCVFVFQMTAEGKAQLEADATPSAKLAKLFFSKLRENHARLKAIAKICNADQLQVGRATKKLISSYNSKPFLTGPTCHSFFIPTDKSYFEIDIDMHRYTYATRKGIASMLNTVPKMVIDIGMVVQGDKPHELPEQLLAGLRMNLVDFTEGRVLAVPPSTPKNKKK